MRLAGSLDLRDGFYFTKAKNAVPIMGKHGSSSSLSLNWDIT